MRRFVLLLAIGPILADLAAAPVVAQSASPLPEQPTWAREIAVTGLDSAFALAHDGQGRLVVAGSAALNVVFVRLHTDGRIDSTFGTNGIVQLQPDPANRSVLRTLAVEPDGRIVAAGTTGAAGRGDVLVVRLLADGRRDASFGTNGVFRREVSGDDRVRALLFGDNLSLFIAGSNQNVTSGGTGQLQGRSAFVMQLNQSGGLTGFGRNGVAYLTPGEASEATTLAHSQNGTLIVGAVRQTGSDVSAVFFPLDSNGDELTFPGGGSRVLVPLPSGSDGPLGLVQGLYGVYGAAARNGGDVLVTTFPRGGTNARTGTFDAGGADVPKGYVGTSSGYTLVAGTSDGQLGFLLSNDPHTVGGIDPSGITVPNQTTARRYAVGGRPTGFEALVLDGYLRRAYVAGWTAGTAGRTSLLVAAFDLPALVAGEDADAPEGFALAVSPVPVRGVATVRVSAPSRLTLVDALGRIVRTLDVAAGTHPLDVADLAAGLYVLRAAAEGRTVTRTLPVVR